MTGGDNAEILASMGRIRDLIVEGGARYEKGDADGMADDYAEDAVLTAPGIEPLHGRAAIRDFWASSIATLGEATVEVGRSLEEADIYFGEFTARATNSGDIEMPDGTTIPATGRPVVISGAEIVLVRDGKIIEHRMFWDGLDVMGQLGLLPG